MREILLRAKEFGTGEWVQGTGVVTDGINTWIVSNKENTPVAFGTTHKKVCPETVGQWTGLVDKNGVKIFEGDILKPSFDEKWKCLVKFKEGAFGVKYMATYLTFCDFYGSDAMFEVIGNIHDKAVEE